MFNILNHTVLSGIEVTGSLPLAEATHLTHLPSAFVIGVIVFVLAIFIGIEVITKVPSTLHTPLMSGSNAISGITIVGAMTCSMSDSIGSLGVVLGFCALVVATVNVVGGYLVTHRMLKMFAPKKKTDTNTP